MIGGWVIIVMVGLGFWMFFKVCDEFAKSDLNPTKSVAKSVVGGIIAYKAAELLSKSRAKQNAEKGGRSVVDDINDASR